MEKYFCNNEGVICSQESIEKSICLNLMRGDKHVPHGSIVNNIEYSKSINGYKTCSTFTSVYDKSMLLDCENVQALLVNEDFYIQSPYQEWEAVANDIALMLLLKYNVVTIHASAIIYREEAFIFSGKSNSGKTTIAKWIEKNFNTAKNISDDHIHIRYYNGKILLSVPIWDEKYDESGWINVKRINFFLLEGEKENIEIIDILKCIVLFGYVPDADDIIVRLVEEIFSNNKKVNLFAGKEKKWEYNMSLVSNVIGAIK